MEQDKGFRLFAPGPSFFQINFGTLWSNPLLGFDPIPLHKQKTRSFNRVLMEREKGIEPSYPAWKAGVLPLNYSRKLSAK